MSSTYKQRLQEKITTLFMFLRYTFKDIDNTICQELNEEYEEELLILAGMIPNDWIAGFYDSVEMAFDIAKCLNVQLLADTIDKHSKARLWFSLDTYSLFMDKCVRGQGWGTQVEKAVDNICIKFKPIFRALDKLFANPAVVLKRIAKFADATNENNNILNDFM